MKIYCCSQTYVSICIKVLTDANTNKNSENICHQQNTFGVILISLKSHCT